MGRYVWMVMVACLLLEPSMRRPRARLPSTQLALPVSAQGRVEIPGVPFVRHIGERATCPEKVS